MREPASKRFVRLTLRAAAALALFAAPGHFTSNSLAKLLVATAYADNGNGGGNGNGGNGGGGNSGGGNAGGNSGNSNSGGGNANAGPGNNSGKGNTNPGGKAASHVNAATGDIVEIDGNRITIIHRNGMKEEIENGRFEMSDAQGRTIVERRATEKDLARLLGL
ncbi:hypothetical protein EOA32_36340 [Mesorhizobium sp. M1A.F.Ca.ET.072.01.1.1]|uniref:hypothetical protein n=1 Tax=Mesorhizobium sp. M1A.F.Ca.ET.072.01.1.1 TaxID=2496753 RepID=UPI000FD36831|nr:hypothetical protein [Mesorhizobium sp. M1A.F.Ca.ET.072.01.1.1]RUW44585.1 hypothetical protein EOA32_36340 [Mesorhizobium sp. M1A.F.Ca.ET.072.01.1.1]